MADSLLQELEEERGRCDRLKECLEIEREERHGMEAALSAEVKGILYQTTADSRDQVQLVTEQLHAGQEKEEQVRGDTLPLPLPLVSSLSRG